MTTDLAILQAGFAVAAAIYYLAAAVCAGALGLVFLAVWRRK